ncbi:YceD family protein [Marinospirillum sp.]|uniref:YceD family protein n=1 Tax=Marinospirillum sp. TaxID=2183934 RepID=UPI003A873E56
MANEYLHSPLDPYKFCAAGKTLSFDLPLQNMERVQEALCETEGQLKVDLEFSYGTQRTLQVQGRLQGQVILECQRCLQPVRQELDSEFLWGLVTSDEAAVKLPRTHEPVFIENERLQLGSVLEDEVLLALPLVAYHPKGECKQYEIEQPALEETLVATPPNNPFSALADLKHSLKKEQ